MFELDRETFREGEIRGRKEGIKLGEQKARKQLYEKIKEHQCSEMDSEKILEIIKEKLKPKSQHYQ